MASLRERVIAAVVARCETALPYADVKRNVDAPDRAPPGGLVIVRDGDPGEPERTFSPLSYTYQHAIDIEVVATSAASDRSAALDDMLTLLATIFEADRTLGGLCEWVEPSAADTADALAAGAQPTRWAGFDLIAVYSTANPLT